MSSLLSFRASAPVRPARLARPARVAVGAAAALLLLSACLTEQELHAVARYTEARQQHGLAGLEVHPELQTKAHQWAEHLAATGSLQHSDVTSGIAAPWVALGETVSSAGSLDDAFAIQMSSATHRAKLLDGKFTHVGMGVATGADGTVYLVVNLMQL